MQLNADGGGCRFIVRSRTCCSSLTGGLVLSKQEAIKFFITEARSFLWRRTFIKWPIKGLMYAQSDQGNYITSVSKHANIDIITWCLLRGRAQVNFDEHFAEEVFGATLWELRRIWWQAEAPPLLFFCLVLSVVLWLFWSIILMDDSSSCLSEWVSKWVSVCLCVCVWGGGGFGQRQRLKVEIEKQRECRRGSGTELKSHEYVLRGVEEEVPRGVSECCWLCTDFSPPCSPSLSTSPSIPTPLSLCLLAPFSRPASLFLTIILTSFIYICQAQTSLHKERT